MRKLALLALVAVGCTKEAPAPAGRPLDVCGDVKAQVDCAKVADVSLQGQLADAGNSPAQNCFWVGNQQFHCGLFEAAAKSLQQSADLQPDPRTFHALGEADFLQEKWLDAESAYSRAVEADPKKRESWVRLALVRVRLKQFPEAHAAAQRALELDPNKPDALRADADALSAQGQFDKAVDALHAAEKLGGETNLSACAQQEVDVLTLKLRKLQKDHAQEEQLADCQAQLGDALDKELARGAVTDRKQVVETWRELADARLGSGDFTKAEAALQKTAELDPKDFVSARLTALIREKKGDAPGARAAIAASLKVEPKQAMPYIILGRLDAAAGDSASAKKDFAQALTNEDGKDALETRQLAELAGRVGELARAEALYTSLDEDPDMAARVDFWVDQAGAAAAAGHPEAVKKACAKAHAIVETIACPAPKK